MKKAHFLSIVAATLFLLATNKSNAQMAINTNGNAPHGSAMLDVSSNSKGLLVPRMTTSQRDAIDTPATGLLIFQTDGTPGFYYNSGTQASPTWTALSGGGGASSAGTIIPFSSGGANYISTKSDGTPEYIATMGFGVSTNMLSTGSTIDLTGGVFGPHNHTFMMPRDGVITSMSAYFSFADALALVGTTVTITAQLYTSSTPNNIFLPVPGASVTLAPSLTGAVAIGTTSNGITTGLNIPVTAQTLCLLVYSVAVTGGIPTAVSFGGFSSAAINIQ